MATMAGNIKFLDCSLHESTPSTELKITEGKSLLSDSSVTVVNDLSDKVSDSTIGPVHYLRVTVRIEFFPSLLKT